MNTLTPPVVHPNAQRLESLAAGDHDADADAHLTACALCSDYVARLRSELVPLSTLEVEKFLTPRKPPAKQRQRRAWMMAAPLAAAAVLLLTLRFSSGPPAAPNAPDPHVLDGATGVRFKGPSAVAVVRERGGAQERLVHEVVVRSGDRLRLEVSTPADGPLAAGVLATDGTWVALIDAAVLSAGTHFSDHAVRFDEQPTEGVIVVGHPEAVALARQTRRFDEVTIVALRYERTP